MGFKSISDEKRARIERPFSEEETLVLKSLNDDKGWVPHGIL